MTHEERDPVPLPPPPPGYDADEGAFAGFTRGFAPLAESLRGNALTAHTGLDGNAFSRVGNEVGLADAIRNVTQRQVDRVNGLATNTDAMTEAVGNTWVNYVDMEDDRSRMIGRSGGDQV